MAKRIPRRQKILVRGKEVRFLLGGWEVSLLVWEVTRVLTLGPNQHGLN